MKGAEEFEVFELNLLRRIKGSACGQGGVDIACAWKDDVALHAVVLEPGVDSEVESSGPDRLRGWKFCRKKGVDGAIEACGAA